MKTVTTGGSTLWASRATMVLILCIACWWGCTKTEPPPRPLGETIQVSAAESYIGMYQHKDTNQIITIGYLITVSPAGEGLQEVNSNEVYISNLVGSAETTVEAIWNGAAYIIDAQEVKIGITPMTISGRVALRENKLTVYYHLTSEISTRTHSETYLRLT